ncbi:MAG: biotin--[acetyl-CoA-carboxylase] ligase [Desulfobacteraceae bacterium]|nr:biotin--[acetyl-CoA-carboxylase] ligase [Desulfobacteraceae bacterium]
MVNENMNIKTQILDILSKSQGKTVSGVKLSSNLNISRVAIWKHIKALKENGVAITSSSKGYLLCDHEDLLYPFCFDKAIQDRIFHFHEVETTMDKARSLAKSGVKHLSIVVAEHQTKGRGRLNRKWFSSKGGLWFTLILKPDVPAALSYIYNFAASLSLAKSLKKSLNLDISVKWPNDLLLNGYKLAGLLSEMETQGDMVCFLNIGIGINVNNEPKTDEPKSVSLKEILKKNVSRKSILTNFLNEFEQQIQTIEPKKIINQWKQQTSTIGCKVRIETYSDIYTGLAMDVDETGALLLKTDDGVDKKIIYGDCFHTKE